VLGIGDLPQNQEGFLTLSNGGDKEREEATKKRESEEQGIVKESAWNGITQFVFGLVPLMVGFLHLLIISSLSLSLSLSLSDTNTAPHGMQIRPSLSLKLFVFFSL
jgi:hypothetical protein